MNSKRTIKLLSIFLTIQLCYSQVTSNSTLSNNTKPNVPIPKMDLPPRDDSTDVPGIPDTTSTTILPMSTGSGAIANPTPDPRPSFGEIDTSPQEIPLTPPSVSPKSDLPPKIPDTSNVSPEGSPLFGIISNDDKLPQAPEIPKFPAAPVPASNPPSPPSTEGVTPQEQAPPVPAPAPESSSDSAFPAPSPQAAISVPRTSFGGSSPAAPSSAAESGSTLTAASTGSPSPSAPASSNAGEQQTQSASRQASSPPDATTLRAASTDNSPMHLMAFGTADRELDRGVQQSDGFINGNSGNPSVIQRAQSGSGLASGGGPATDSQPGGNAGTDQPEQPSTSSAKSQNSLVAPIAGSLTAVFVIAAVVAVVVAVKRYRKRDRDMIHDPSHSTNDINELNSKVEIVVNSSETSEDAWDKYIGNMDHDTESSRSTLLTSPTSYASKLFKNSIIVTPLRTDSTAGDSIFSYDTTTTLDRPTKEELERHQSAPPSRPISGCTDSSGESYVDRTSNGTYNSEDLDSFIKNTLGDF